MVYLSSSFQSWNNFKLFLVKEVRKHAMPFYIVVVCLLIAFLANNCAPPAPGSWVCTVEITSDGPYELELFYRSSKEQEFDASRRIKAYKVHHSSPEIYQMALPDTVPVIDLRLDLGSDSTLVKAQIHKITLKNKDGIIEISAEELPHFFSLNIFATFGTEPGCIKVNPKNGRFDPFLIAKPILQHRLQMTQKGIWY